jgi:hypothetical protein
MLYTEMGLVCVYEALCEQDCNSTDARSCETVVLAASGRVDAP